SGISVVCFAASYAVALGLEITRLFVQLRIRWLLIIGFSVAGLVAHSVHLLAHARSEIESSRGVLLSNWYDWCLLVAWILVAAYLGLAIRRPRNTVGLFLLPLALALIGLARLVREIPSFPREQAINSWAMIHGLLLLLGTVTAALGFAAGVMYLLQSYRLKHKLPPRPGFRLPSLEWLHRFNRRTLLISTALVAMGLAAGMVVNAVRNGGTHEAMTWRDPIVLTSLLVFVWLAAVSVFEGLYRPAREGRRVAWMTLFSFVFLAMVLSLVLLGQHGISRSRPASERGGTSPADRSGEPVAGVGGNSR
ncbi:MAG: cytochrome C assembly protein, partial [Planctomycetes bacterium]|nr:cytochrome C assembly protein [Planctomycetota bacterium]